MLESAHISRMQFSLRLVCMLMMMVLLHGCATSTTPVADESDWPSSLPDRQLFVRAWQQDGANQFRQSEEEYLGWVRSFFLGSGMTSGWIEMSNEVRSRVDPQTAERAAPLLAGLGLRIGREWAKDNSVRRIDTRMVSVWRTALTEAIWQNDLLPFLARLEDDVGGLLSDTLPPEVIEVQRYYLIEEPEFE